MWLWDVRKSDQRHLLTNKHNELMKLVINNNKTKTLDNYFKDDHQDVKPIIADAVNTSITAENVSFIESITPPENEDLNSEPIENKTIQNESIVVIPNKFTKSE